MLGLDYEIDSVSRVTEGKRKEDALRVDTQPRFVRLHEPPQDVFRGFVNIVSAGVFREVAGEGYLGPALERKALSKDGTELTLRILFLKTSILFRNSTIDVRRNHREFITEEKRRSDSAMRFWESIRVRNEGLERHRYALDFSPPVVPGRTR